MDNNFENNNDIKNDSIELETNVENEPTVKFENVEKVPTETKNTGIKVFFSIVSVMIALIIAVSAGYIFGKRDDEKVLNFEAPNIFESKDETIKHSSYSEVFNKTKSSVVFITVYNDKDSSQGYGSGVIYSSDGYIVTNDHLYSNVESPKFIVTLVDGSEYPATFIAGDTRSDLAVLKIDATGLNAASFGNYSEVVVGEEVIAVGYPFGVTEGPILTVGTVSSAATRVTTTSSYAVKMIQTDTAINPGSSGGALINMYSQVIGITSAKLVGTVYDSVGYAIPSSTVVKIVNSLIKNGYVADRGKLGITYTAIDTVASLKNNVPKGLEIVEVNSNSDLYGKKIGKGDIITHINDVMIVNSNVALDIIESTLPGQSMSFTVYHPSTKTTETIYGSLIPDPGSSSYKKEVAENNNPLTEFEDYFSDH